MNSALHQAVAFEAAQGLGKHFLRNAPDFALQRGVTHGPAPENLDDESGPFIRNSVEHQPGGTLRVHDGRGRGRFWHALL